MPYTALTMHMTNDPKERDSVTLYSESLCVLFIIQSGCIILGIVLQILYVVISMHVHLAPKLSAITYSFIKFSRRSKKRYPFPVAKY